MKKIFSLLVLVIILTSCNQLSTEVPKSESGVSKASIKVQTDENGNTIEQKEYNGKIEKR